MEEECLVTNFFSELWHLLTNFITVRLGLYTREAARKATLAFAEQACSCCILPWPRVSVSSARVVVR